MAKLQSLAMHFSHDLFSFPHMQIRNLFGLDLNSDIEAMDDLACLADVILEGGGGGELFVIPLSDCTCYVGYGR